MEEIKILTIDDDPVVTSQIRDLLNAQEIGGYRLTVEVENDFENGKTRLQETEYDIVILDVYRGNQVEGNTDQPGTEVLETIKAAVPIAVIFYTGLTSHVEESASGMVRIVSKTTAGGLEREITSLIETDLPLIRKRIAAHTREVLRKYYWDVVDNHPDFINISDDEPLLEYLLLRRLANTLNREGVEKIFGKTISKEKIHPLSFYIFPASQEDTYEMGDILRKNDDSSHHVVLTPSCDLVQKKAEYLHLVPTLLLTEVDEYKNYLKHKSTNTEESKKKLVSSKEALGRIIGSRKSDRFFFLPRNEFISMPDLVIDFQQGSNHKIEAASQYKLAGYTKIAKIDDPFAQDMLAMFVRNRNRPGSPDLDEDHIINYLDNEITTKA